MAAPAPLVPCFYTTVKNVSGFDRYFGFLGAHGKFMKAGTEYTEYGDIIAKFNSLRGPRNQYRNQKALQQALAGVTRGDGRVVAASLHIKQTPSFIVFDTGTSTPKQITSVNGVFGTADPCYGAGY